MEKFEKLGLFTPLLNAVLEELNPEWNRFHAFEPFPWLDCIAFLAFERGDTALSLDRVQLHRCIESIFNSIDQSNESLLTNEEIDIVVDSCLETLSDRKLRQYNLYDDPLEPLLSFPFILHHDSLIASHLYRIASSFPIAEAYKKSDIVQSIYQKQKAILSIRCNRAQREAIEASIAAPFSIIYGGPGTGKTYTAGALITLLVDLFHGVQLSKGKEKKEIPPYRILVTAPTGKAVFTLKKSIEQYFENAVAEIGLENRALDIDALTIHAYLIQQEKLGEERGYHAIIVDESSMIDSRLMAQFLAYIRTGVRLIMMGDPDQLPPIAPGQPFLDIIRASSLIEEDRVQFPISYLSSCMRAELAEIVALSKAVVEKKRESFFSLLDSETVRFTENDGNCTSLLPILYEKVAAPWECSDRLSFEEGIALSMQSKILSPIRKSGRTAVIELNALLSKELVKKRRFQDSNRFLEPILIVKNNYALEAMNGDIGIMETIGQRGSYSKKIYLPRSSVHLIPEALCRDYEQNYAMTVHKSQGSEFQQVVLLLPDSPAHITIPLLYTAITRARREIMIFGKKAVLESLFVEGHRRTTALFRTIKNLFDKKFF